MAYVTIPKDLSKVKNKVFLNLTKRQLVCMGFAAGIGVPFYFLMRDTLGTSNAAAGMVLLMLPDVRWGVGRLPISWGGKKKKSVRMNFPVIRMINECVRI